MILSKNFCDNLEENQSDRGKGVLYRVPDPGGGGGGSFLRGGPHVKQNPRKGVLNFLEDPHPRIL